MVFRILLWLVGVQLVLGSRLSSRLRRQLGQNLTFTLAAKNGVARTYTVLNRRFSSEAGISSSLAGSTLTFESTRQGVGILLAKNAVEQIVDGLGRRVIELEGDPTTVLWFYEMVFGFLPWRKTPRHDIPDAYVTPNPNGKVAARITREPAVDELDPSWSGAVRQREKLVMWQVGQGAVVPNKPVAFQHVVDVPEDHLESSR
jgi:hypothetical protein